MVDMRGQAAPACARVSVEAAARLHMGFLDLNGGLGRRFGSLGVGLRDLGTRLTITPAPDLWATGLDADRVLGYARDLCRHLALPPAAAIHVTQTVPSHVGLGSGTQLALAVGVGLARFYGLPVSVRDVARLTERGARSGIGVGVFEHGGFVLDGGRGRDDTVPPVIVRAVFPDEWRFILVFDENAQGLHGPEELTGFRRLPVFPAERAAHLCRLVLMQLLPALTVRDLPAFGDAVTELQGIVGDYFAPAQGGRFSSRRVSQALAWLERAGAKAIGQSSWGPTGFAVVSDARRAAELIAGAELEFGAGEQLRFIAAAARNAGATVEAGESHAARAGESAARTVRRGARA